MTTVCVIHLWIRSQVFCCSWHHLWSHFANLAHLDCGDCSGLKWSSGDPSSRMPHHYQTRESALYWTCLEPPITATAATNKSEYWSNAHAHACLTCICKNNCSNWTSFADKCILRGSCCMIMSDVYVEGCGQSTLRCKCVWLVPLNSCFVCEHENELCVMHDTWQVCWRLTTCNSEYGSWYTHNTMFPPAASLCCLHFVY